ncbi:MAG: hypothetical protein AAF657_03825, partial [Acidobacteriota bacterium]
NVVPGDYLVRSFPAMHFNRGIWGIFRVAPKDLGSDGCYYSPSSQHAAIDGGSADEATLAAAPK